MTFQKMRMLVVAKTYPNLSKKYDRTVCTAGIDLDSGTWIRVFPIRFFDLDYKTRPAKYDIIDVEVEPTRDKFLRRESHKARDETIKIVGHIGTENNWSERKRILLPLLRKSIEELNLLYPRENISIGIIKPKRILDFKITPIDKCRDWERDLILGKQKTLSGEYKSPLDKIPFKFSYVFECDDDRCNQHDLMIEDWELCALFRQERQRIGEEKALQEVRQKYFDIFTTKNDIYLIVGTESTWNSWLIIGVFYPKKEN